MIKHKFTAAYLEPNETEHSQPLQKINTDLYYVVLFPSFPPTLYSELGLFGRLHVVRTLTAFVRPNTRYPSVPSERSGHGGHNSHLLCNGFITENL